MNKPITQKEMKDWVGKTWDRCQEAAWSEPMKDWVMELCPEIAEWQAEIIAEQVRIRVESEREACAKLCENEAEKWEGDDGPISTEARLCAINIRARRETAPPQRKPLTEEEIEQEYKKGYADGYAAGYDNGDSEGFTRGTDSMVPASLAAWRAQPQHTPTQSTHSADCYKWHHECAIARIEETEELREALKTALAESEKLSKPVAWMHTNGVGHVYFRKKPQDKVFNPRPVYLKDE